MKSSENICKFIRTLEIILAGGYGLGKAGVEGIGVLSKFLNLTRSMTMGGLHAFTEINEPEESGMDVNTGLIGSGLLSMLLKGAPAAAAATGATTQAPLGLPASSVVGDFPLANGAGVLLR